MVKFCQNCYDTKNKIYPTGYSWEIKPEITDCPWCHAKNSMINIDFPPLEMYTLLRVSKNRDFVEAMMDLREKNPIEYQLKLSQFELTVKQMDIEKQKNVPKCPKCGSTSITTGARGVNAFWGFVGASKTVNRCGSCGHTWKPR